MVALALYVGAYYATVGMKWVIDDEEIRIDSVYSRDARTNGLLRQFFRPVHWSDRQIRRPSWTPASYLDDQI